MIQDQIPTLVGEGLSRGEVQGMIVAYWQENVSKVVDPRAIEMLVRTLLTRAMAQQAAPVLEAQKQETRRGFTQTGQQVASLATEVERLQQGQRQLAQQTRYLLQHTT